MNHNYENGLYSLNYVLYRRIMSYSKPRPYETECVDYGERGDHSLLECIEKCRIELSRKYLGKNRWPGNYLNYDGESEDRMEDLFEMFQKNWQEDQNLGEACKSRCGRQTQCYSEFYLTNTKHFERPFNVIYIPIFPPHMPDLVYTHSAFLEFVEFITYVGSAISLHFGISGIMLSEFFIKFSKYVYNKTKVYLNVENSKIQIKNQMFLIKTPKIIAKSNRRKRNLWAKIENNSKFHKEFNKY